jgi:hypothetical protein
MTEPTPTATDARDVSLPDRASAEIMLSAALGQIRWARRYTLELLAATPRELWFERPRVVPSGGEDSATNLPRAETIEPGQDRRDGGEHDEPERLRTHIAWQVGHLAVSQYGLLMFRIHGRRDDDLELIPGRFRKAFARQSDPAGVSSSQWSADELAERLERVHTAALHGLMDRFDSDILLQSVEMPYAVYPIKLGAILFCPLHEHIHSGQIGLIRRCLGLVPVR